MFFFSNRLGCMKSLLISAAITLLILVLARLGAAAGADW
jgi:hypothetical protein